MAVQEGHAEIELKVPVCTESPDGAEIYPFGTRGESKHVTNTGMERNGGITNLYEQEVAPTVAGKQHIAKNGKTITLETVGGGVYIEGKFLQSVSLNGVQASWKFANVDDVALANSSILTVKRKTPYVVTLSSYSYTTGLLVASRDITFATSEFVGGRSINFVRYPPYMEYADNQEFIINNPGSSTRICKEAAGVVLSFTTAIAETDASSVFCFRFENGYYLYGLPGNIAENYYVSDTAGTSAGIKAKYALIQTSGAFSRAIITKTPTIVATEIQAYGLVGYTTFLVGGWSATVVYTANVGDANAITSSITGFGYSDVIYTTAAAVIQGCFHPHPYLQATKYMRVTPNATHVNGCGCITNNYGLPSLLEFRIGYLNGIQAFVSVAQNSAAMKNHYFMGVLLSNVGEFDNTYTPQTSVSETAILYAFNGSYYVKSIGSTISNRIQKIDDRLYKLNTISPSNIVDTESDTIEYGSIDYNGRECGAGVATTGHTLAYVIHGRYCNSIDPGEKLIAYTYATATAAPFGYMDPAFVMSFGISFYNNLLLDVYLDALYNTSFVLALGAATFIVAYNANKADLLYLPETSLPVAMGSTYGSFCAQTLDKTLFLLRSYADPSGDKHTFDAYVVGNDIFGFYSVFVLFGQIYLYDGYKIWTATFTGNAFTEKQYVADAVGMTLIAAAPTKVYFLSAFDNSIYGFDGGRSLVKELRLNQQGAITDGVFNVRDNTLLLQSSTELMWIRDNIITVNAKKSTQTSLKLYDTTGGLVVANDSFKWTYSFALLSASTVVALSWQSGFFGQTANQKSLLARYILTVWSATRAAVTLTVTHYWYDAENYGTQTVYFDILPNDWDALGFYRCRFIPNTQRTLASSIGLATTSKIVLNRVVVEFADDAQAMIAASRSK